MAKRGYLSIVKTMMAKRESRLLGISVLIVTTIWYLFIVGRGSGGPLGLGFSSFKLRIPELKHVNPDAPFSSLVLRAQFADFTPDLTEHIGVSIPMSTGIWGEVDVTAPPRSASAVVVRFPLIPPQVDASSILFGVSTTLSRLDDSLHAFAHRAVNTGTRFVVSISPSDDKKGLTNDGVAARARTLGLNVTIVEIEQSYIERYVSLIEIMDPHIEPSTKWIGIIDDDTFFPSAHRLLSILSKYDTSVPQYVGGITEDILAFQKWGYLAFGGAGLFMSVPLVRKIQPHTEKCQQMDIYSGDAKISQCIYQYTTTKLNVEPCLHQLDLFGDFTGFFEAARPLPASLHHWKSWGHYDVVQHSRIAKLTGQNSIYQKFALTDGYWMTHGFSIVKYSTDEVEGSLSRFEGSMEKTFDKLEGETDKTFLHSLAPLRPKDQGKVQYMLEATVEEEEARNTMSLYYVRREGGAGTGVIRVIWTVK